MPAFVLELGTEELPSRFLLPVEKQVEDAFIKTLDEAGVSYSGLSASATPRRIAAFIENLSEYSERKEETVTGPSLKAAYDIGGRPTRAAEGFANSNGVSLEQTFVIENEKGSYIAVKKLTGGEPISQILEKVCPSIISSLNFPKSMKWGSGTFTFARPLRWILALLDSHIVNFSLAGLASSNETYGHRVHGFGPFSVSSPLEYKKIILEKGQITLNGKDRRDTIVIEGDNLAAAVNGHILWDDSLLDEVQGLCEHPVPMLGSFEQIYLEIPQQVLLTSMQSHQKSFGVQSASGKLLPYFLTVLNITPKDPALVKKGWERVLRARLEDARFFWKTDLNSSFAHWLESLDSVIFLAPLGSMGDKTRRIAELAGWLANNSKYTFSDAEKARADDAIRAGRLSKADLVSEMVKEFDTLQGVMGGIYAERLGETSVVAQAIAEQYLPAGPDSPVPSTITGALVSIADKVDTLVGCFGLGMIPTGTADPYALRRATLGISRILIEKGLRVNLPDLFAKSQEIYGERKWKIEPEQALLRLADFFSLRLKNLFIAQGYDGILAEAVLQADAKDPFAASSRLQAFADFAKTPQFPLAVQTFKRVANIIRKQSETDDSGITGAFTHDLLSEEQEVALVAELEKLQPIFLQLSEQEEFSALFSLLAEIRPVVDAFFEHVMVMCDDVAVRNNRLNILKTLLNQFETLADFSSLQM